MNSGALAGAGTPMLASLRWVANQVPSSAKLAAPVLGCTASASSKLATAPNGRKSVAGAKPGAFMVSGTMATVWVLLRKMTEPSAGAAFRAWAAICPPAPGLLSTSTGWPNCTASFSATMRAAVSAGPPGG